MTIGMRGEYEDFHQGALLCGVWLLVIFVGVHTMSAMRAILEPLLWAFFFMMALVPIADAIECLLLRGCRGAAACLDCGCCRRRRDYAAVSVVPRNAAADDEEAAVRSLVSEEKAEPSRAAAGRSGLEKCVRVVAVITVVASFFGMVSLFFTMVYESAHSMQGHWKNYEAGAKRMVTDLNRFSTILKTQVPHHLMQNATEKALRKVEEVLSLLIGAMVENVSGILIEIVMVLLYMIFWLCNPIDVHVTVAVLFKRYILLKSLASAMYATCVWLLLHTLGIELAVVFGLVTFLFNFIPEIGPMIAAILPAPVVLLDGTLTRPWFTLGVVLIGQVALKFVFGNIVEVLLIERQRDMKMHPVVILFFLAFFGWIWGPTGMLLSVPLMAAAKAAMHIIPPAYRNPLLVLLEGDRTAPERYTSEVIQKEIVKEMELLDNMVSGRNLMPYVGMDSRKIEQ